MNRKHLTENERMYYKINRTIANCELAITVLILAGLLFILFWVLQWTATGSQRGSIAHDPGFSHQAYRPDHLMINGKASNVAGLVNLVAMVEAKKAIPCNGDGLIVVPTKKSIFDSSKDSRPFESRQPMNPIIANIGPSGCLFYARSDCWHRFIPLPSKPLPRGCILFIERFLSDSAVIIAMMNHGIDPRS